MEKKMKLFSTYDIIYAKGKRVWNKLSELTSLSTFYPKVNFKRITGVLVRDL